MSKRRAKDDLNSLNWDRDDREQIEEEERAIIGSEFKKASDDVLSRRVIRKAKRSLPERDDNQEEQKVSLFSNFQGFKKPEATTTTTTTAIPSFNFLEKFNEQQQQQQQQQSTTVKRPKTDQSVRLAKIKGLNESVMRWITDHVRTNPLCDLTPIFDDYRKYWSEIDAEDTTTKTTMTMTTTEIVTKTDTGSEKVTVTEPVKQLFTFPTSQPAAAPAATPFSFNLLPTATTTSPFTFKPQTNGDGLQVVQGGGGGGGGAGGDENDDEDNQPPPIEDSFDDIKEDGSIFSIKCKVFFMENGAFQDKGICYAFLKPVNSKLQLIARLNNKLGTIVVNTLLTKTMASTIQKRNEKNVLITCIPNAAQAQNPLPVLFKVKSATDADRFVQTLNDNLN